MLDTHIEIIQAWLEEDLLVHRKQRRTATAIYNQLKAETDYEGSDRTVRYYVKEFKKEIYAKYKQDRQYARLEHLPGIAQVDFGDFYASETQADGGLFPFCAFSRIILISPLLIIRSTPIKAFFSLLW